MTFYLKVTFSQNTNKPYIEMGLGLRFQPINLINRPYSIYRYGSYTKFHDAKPRIVISINNYVGAKKNTLISFSNYFTSSNIKFTGNEDVRLLRDHIIDINKEIKFKKKGARFIIGLGGGLMNCGSSFKYLNNYIDNNGNLIIDSSATYTQRYFAPRFILGLKKKELNASFIFHITPDLDGEKYPALWMEAKFAFTLFKF